MRIFLLKHLYTSHLINFNIFEQFMQYFLLNEELYSRKKVALGYIVNPRAVLIDDKVMAEVFTKIFEYIWNKV